MIAKRPRTILLLSLLFLAVLLLTYYAVGAKDSGPHSTSRISVNDLGEEGDGDSLFPDITADGRFVAFQSRASNLVPGDTNGIQDMFVFDRETGEIERVSVSSEGQEGNDSTYYAPSIADDGTIIAFVSAADNLVQNDTNGVWDVFVHDRQTELTTRVSVSSTGEEANNHSALPAVSSSGRYVVFDSTAGNLIPGGIIGQQVYRHDLETGSIELVSATAAEPQANGTSRGPAVSADGRFVAFSSWATNLVPDDTNNTEDVFVKDMLTGLVERVSLNYLGEENNGWDWSPKISADGRYVAFTSYAEDMYPGDPDYAKVYLYDRETDRLERVSVNLNGQQGAEPSYAKDISGDGRFVLFSSASPNLVPGVQNGERDVYVRDRRYNFLYRVSLADDDSESNGFSNQSSLTADGQTIAFQSEADNLVLDDTNEESDVFIRVQISHTIFLPKLSYIPSTG